MHSEATKKLFAFVENISRLCAKDTSSEGEKAHALAAFGLMFQLGQEQGQSRVRMTDISRYLMISKPAATQAVNRMVEKGLLLREHDEKDRRVVYIRPTDEGARQFNDELDRRLSFIDRVVNRMGDDKAEKLAKLMNLFFICAADEVEEK